MKSEEATGYVLPFFAVQYEKKHPQKQIIYHWKDPGLKSLSLIYIVKKQKQKQYCLS